MYRIIKSIFKHYTQEPMVIPPEGEIRAKLRVNSGNELKFRINGDSMEVNWGDGNRSGVKKGTEYFTHVYTEGGTFDLTVTGEKIVDVYMQDCYLEKLDVTQCYTLEFLDCSENNLEELDVRNCRQLYELYCGRNRLQELKLSEYPELSYLSCPWNELRSLDLNGCRKLFQLECKGNHLTHLDVSKCKKLVGINIAKNDMTIEAVNQFLHTLAPCSFVDEGDLILGDLWAGCDREICRKKGWG